MCLADIRDNAEVRPAHLHKLGNIVRMTCPHLDDGNISVRSNLQQRQRYAYIIVQVTLRRGDIEPGCKNSPDQLLGRSLPVRSCNAYDRHTPSLCSDILPMPSGQVLQRRERIPYRDYPAATFSVRIR